MGTILKSTTKFLIFILLCFSHTGNLYAESNTEWTLQITFPNYEVKNFRLTNKQYKPFLPKTAWRCNIKETEIKNKIELREITCTYSIKKYGSFSSVISCSSEHRYSEFLVNLQDERKNLIYKIFLFCNYVK